MKDIRDKNKDLITMFRGTDKTHKFIAKDFIWNQYNVTCEGRLSSASEVADFSFNITNYTDADGVELGMILFPKDVITNYIRETRFYWKVLATHKINLTTTVINYGEVMLKEV